MILILTQCFPPTSGGIEGLMGGLARELAAAGREVTVFADAHEDAASFDAGTKALFATRRFAGIKPMRRILKARAAMKLIQSGAVEGVFADSWKSLEKLNGAALRRAGAPVIVWAHGNEYPSETTPRKSGRIKAALAKAQKVLSVSEHTARRVAQYSPASLNVTVRHPPFDPPVAPTIEDSEWAEGLWKDSAPRLLSLCRLDPRKGLDSVLQSLPELIKASPGLRYVIAGDGEDQRRLKDLVEKLDLSERVFFAGRVEGGRKSALYSSADAFTVPTKPGRNYAEGFGIVYLEAASFGVSSVAGRDGGAGDAIADGETGLLCDSLDQSSVAAALKRMLTDDDLRKLMGDAARARAVQAVWPSQIGKFLNDIEQPNG